VVRLSTGLSLIVQIQTGTRTFQPGTSVVEGDFCYQFTARTQSLQAYFTLLTSSACLTAVPSNTLAPCPVQPSCSLTFPDVTPSHTFYDEIMSLTALDAVSGYADGTFRPMESMSRGQAMKIIVQTFNIPPAPRGAVVQHFADVPPDSPYFPYVEAIYGKGWIKGYGDGTFKPEQPITRGSLVKVAVQAAGWELIRAAKPTFNDVNTGSPLYPYVETAAAHGILDDWAAADGLFRPDDPATRGWAAATVARAMPAPISNLPGSLEDLLKKQLGNQKH
jgi:hypothetical protein